jgi:hypothetical protein
MGTDVSGCSMPDTEGSAKGPENADFRMAYPAEKGTRPILRPQVTCLGGVPPPGRSGKPAPPLVGLGGDPHAEPGPAQRRVPRFAWGIRGAPLGDRAATPGRERLLSGVYFSETHPPRDES